MTREGSSDLIVIGAGVAGLAAAFRARQLGDDVRVLEAQQRSGGLICTDHVEGFTVDEGADGLLASGPVLSLLSELGLEGDIVRGGSASRRALIATRDGLAPVPPGLFRFERKVALSLLVSPLLPPSAKLRLLVEPFIGRSPRDDESVRDFFVRRLGRDVADRLVDPMLRGVFGAASADLGIGAVMPAVAAMEKRHGSLFWALLTSSRAVSGLGLVTLRGGMGALPDRLRERVSDALVLGAEAVSLTRDAGRWAISTPDGRRFWAPKVILACPVHQAARLLTIVAPDAAQRLKEIESSRVDILTLGFRAALTLPDATGFVSQAAAGLAIAACTFSSQKWSHRAPSDGTLLRVTLDRPDLSTDDLIRVVRGELRDLLRITETPSLIRVRRLERALPIYGVGHVARVEVIRAGLARAPGLAVVGNGYDGIGIPHCVAAGIHAAGASVEDEHRSLAPSQLRRATAR